MPAHRRPTDTTTSKPLKAAVFHILLALAARDNYGYALMQAVREASDGHVPLSPGSFYRHLAKLIDDGLVIEAAPRRAGDDPRRGSPIGFMSCSCWRTRRSSPIASARGCGTRSASIGRPPRRRVFHRISASGSQPSSTRSAPVWRNDLNGGPTGRGKGDA